MIAVMSSYRQIPNDASDVLRILIGRHQNKSQVQEESWTCDLFLVSLAANKLLIWFAK